MRDVDVDADADADADADGQPLWSTPNGRSRQPSTGLARRSQSLISRSRASISIEPLFKQKTIDSTIKTTVGNGPRPLNQSERRSGVLRVGRVALNQSERWNGVLFVGRVALNQSERWNGVPYVGRVALNQSERQIGVLRVGRVALMRNRLEK